ncbi:hypothetical protein [Pseudomonas sp. KBW05]|uniref:hypothetical protein n=1 Tax=Pseudomonas sp. KBW05 TaxID=2153360 RepID=UPI000F59692F|nr:hypothetical protein [Pseudomonas sp. KBW05]RQO51505.1 hypothetical protein DBR46_20525 [Pseudomonas sp. KBW05]
MSSMLLGLLSSETFKRNNKVLEEHFKDGVDELSALLKCHLLIEQNLRDFCNASVLNPSHLKGKRFQFSHVVSLARALIEEPKDLDVSWMWGAIDLLNGLRNSYAHELDPNLLLIEEKKNKLIKLLSPMIKDEPLYKGVDVPLNVYLGILIGALSGYLFFILETRGGLKG